MQNRIWRVGVVLAIIALIVIAQRANAQKVPTGDEFTALRMEFAKKPGAEQFLVNDEERQALLKLFATNKAEFVRKARIYLVKCPVEAKLHLMVAVALGGLPGSTHSPEIIAQRYLFYGLLHSIALSGDGKTKATAYKVISIGEEYVLLEFMGKEFVRQHLNEHYDVMDVMVDKKPETVYFDASIPLELEAHALKPK